MGRTALVVALKALEVGFGDTVIVPSFTCDVVIKAVEFCGAKPIFADVEESTFNVDPLEVEEKISENTKAILVIHCYGQPADMNELLKIANDQEVPLIEDVAHSLGAEYHGKKVGSLGHFSLFSFSKNMNCTSGGAITTNSDNLMSKAREVYDSLCGSEHGINRFRHQFTRKLLGLGRKKRSLLSSIRLLGVARKFVHSTENIPDVFSADEEIAEEVVNGLKNMDNKNEKRRERAQALTELIEDTKTDYLITPFEKEDRTHVYYIYALRVKQRESVLKKLRRTEKHTYLSLPWQCPQGNRAAKLSKQLVLFEMDPNLNDESINLIVSALSRVSQTREQRFS